MDVLVLGRGGEAHSVEPHRAGGPVTGVGPSRVLGKHVAGRLYLAAGRVDELTDAQRALVHRGWGLVDAHRRPRINVVKLDSRAGTVSFLEYEPLEEVAFPSLRVALSVHASRGVRVARYGLDNPPVLHRKELLLGPGHPRFEQFAALTAQCERLGLFREPHRIGTRQAWLRRIHEAGLRLEGHSLVVRGDAVLPAGGVD